MIDPTPKDVGRWVKYAPGSLHRVANGETGQVYEAGVVKAFNKDYVFVAFARGDDQWSGGMACKREQLEWADILTEILTWKPDVLSRQAALDLAVASGKPPKALPHRVPEGEPLKGKVA